MEFKDKIRFLFFDTETTGLDPLNSELLTADFLLFDYDFNKIAEHSVMISKSSYMMENNSKALSVNKINLDELKIKGLPPDLCRKSFEDFLSSNKKEGVDTVLVAHNIEFDLGFIHRYLFSENDFLRFSIKRKLDTLTISRFLYIAGVISPKGFSLSKLFEYFLDNETGMPETDIKDMTSKLHSSKTDCYSLMYVFSCMLSIVSKIGDAYAVKEK